MIERRIYTHYAIVYGSAVWPSWSYWIVPGTYNGD